MTASSSLFTPVQLGALKLRNRIVMSPMTRARAEPGHVPGPLMAEYYAQRASAGLIITECSMVSPEASAFVNDPGIYSDAQVAGWKQVTDAVHAAGGLIALQIWHPGRATHPFNNHGAQPVSSTGRPILGSEASTAQGPQAYPAPRTLTIDEIPQYVAQFRQATVNAQRAGFDAVQIHGAHGYLVDQFLRDGVNDRSDAYGGSIENRARFLFEIVDAAIEVFGAGRVGLRVSPLVAFNDIRDSNPAALTQYVAAQFEQRQAAFFELRHEQFSLPEEQEQARIARGILKTTPLLLNGGFDAASGASAVDAGLADAVVYGKPFISNPDLVARFRSGAGLAAVDFSTLYAPGAKGYTDYPALEAA
jgi:N-ethylmaleimide reductase